MPVIRLKLLQFFLWLYIVISALIFTAKAQDVNTTDNAIFYEVTGNGLTSPSYLFGTFHLLTQSFIDSLPGVMEKFNSCKTMAGEVVIDSSTALKMAPATMLKGTTLDKVLDKKTYKKTAAWLKELGGYDLALFNGVNPMTVNVTLLQLIQAKYFPAPAGEAGMDTYFQATAKKNGMKLVGLESVEEQITALFSQFPLDRQAKMLSDFVNKKEENIAEMKKMVGDYRHYKLADLNKLMYDASYDDSEKKVMLTNRNEKWMKQLPGLMQENPTFVAVGALHLAGDDGLVNQLRKAGYTVTAIALNQ